MVERRCVHGGGGREGCIFWIRACVGLLDIHYSPNVPVRHPRPPFFIGVLIVRYEKRYGKLCLLYIGPILRFKFRFYHFAHNSKYLKWVKGLTIRFPNMVQNGLHVYDTKFTVIQEIPMFTISSLWPKEIKKTGQTNRERKIEENERLWSCWHLPYLWSTEFVLLFETDFQFYNDPMPHRSIR